MQFSRSTQEAMLNLARTEQGQLLDGATLRVPKHGNLFLSHGSTAPSDDFEELATVKLDGIEHYVLKKTKGPVGID